MQQSPSEHEDDLLDAILEDEHVALIEKLRASNEAAAEEQSWLSLA